MMFTFVVAFAGVLPGVLLLVAMAVVTALFVRFGFSYIKAYQGKVSLMSLVTGLECAVYDYCWLEPVPVYSFYVESCYFLRLVQLGCAAWMIGENWEVKKELDPTYFHVFWWSGIGAAGVYFLAYPYYVFFVCADRVAIARAKRDAFIGDEMKNKPHSRVTYHENNDKGIGETPPGPVSLEDVEIDESDESPPEQQANCDNQTAAAASEEKCDADDPSRNFKLSL
jgi:hypothetical protein